ncbi:Cd(II)/Pb(II)-responsive transcriptional regulator [Gammaproteobacteria bacterium ESL0073]|nr:Cd(II)/Pb(II)-responsive transcriptional regulator [Gammaproteobacteria bacterium ESL0073]
MRIGELAELTNCTVETIRYYEKQGLLPKAYRTNNNYRVYSDIHLARLKFIRNCRSLDMTHEEIRELLKLVIDTPKDDCSVISNLLDEHLEHVNTRITELQELQKVLFDLQKRCLSPSSIDHCGIVQELTEKEIPTVHKSHL